MPRLTGVLLIAIGLASSGLTSMQSLRRLASATGGVFVADGTPPAERWLSCHAHLRSPAPQCAGEDPTLDVALAAVLEDLHGRGGQP